MDTGKYAHPVASFSPHLIFQAISIVAAFFAFPYSAAIRYAPVQLMAGQSCNWPTSTSLLFPVLVFIAIVVEVKLTSFGIISANLRRAEHGTFSWALPGTTSPLAASHVYGGLIWAAAGDLSKVLRRCEGIVKEVYQGACEKIKIISLLL